MKLLSLPTLLLVFACSPSEPDVADPPSLPTPPTPDDTADTGADPAWVAAIVPPTDVTAECWSWTVDWHPFTPDEPTNVLLITYDPETLTDLTWSNDSEPDGPDGAFDAFYAYTWDAAFENLVRQTRDLNGDGVVDYIVEQDYDASGVRVALRIDSDADGTFETSWTYFIEDGVTVGAETDDTGDGLVDVWWTFTYDGSGRRVHVEGDRLDDGTIDHRIDYVWDETVTDGQAYTILEDRVLDGVPEVREYVHYNAADQLVYREWEVPTTRTHNWYTYTSDGDVATREVTYWIDGEFNDHQTYAYTYEAPGREIHVDTTVSFNEDGSDPYLSHTDTTWFCP